MNIAWIDRAACADHPALTPEDWFATAHDRTSRNRCARWCRLCGARAACLTCPVDTECLAAALHEEGDVVAALRFGVRGALDPAERAALARTAAAQAISA